jgi:Anthrone oxygenase
MIKVATLLATLCCGVFFGAALYVSLVQHPAALETGNDFATRFFPPMYRRAAILQASLALVGCASGIAAWLSGAGRLWLVAAVLIGSAVPFTLIVIKPVNDALLQGHLLPADELGRLLVRWGYLHWARTVASGLASLLYLVGLVSQPQLLTPSEVLDRIRSIVESIFDATISSRADRSADWLRHISIFLLREIRKRPDSRRLSIAIKFDAVRHDWCGR